VVKPPPEVLVSFGRLYCCSTRASLIQHIPPARPPFDLSLHREGLAAMCGRSCVRPGSLFEPHFMLHEPQNKLVLANQWVHLMVAPCSQLLLCIRPLTNYHPASFMFHYKALRRDGRPLVAYFGQPSPLPRLAVMFGAHEFHSVLHILMRLTRARRTSAPPARASRCTP
jgi:hypothetical protein